MAMTLRGIAVAARAAMTVVLTADVAAAARVAGPAILFGLGYATAVLALVAFRRRALAEIAIGAAAALTVAWAIRASGDDAGRLGAALAGAACGVLPAALRDLDRAAGGEDRMALRDVFRMRRRRAPSRSTTRLLPDLRRRSDRPFDRD